MEHQKVAMDRMRGREFYGLFMEQGTGKTWCFLADAERLYLADKIGALLVIAPNGVHTNWVRREIPQHLSAPHIARAWRSGPSQRHLRSMEDLFKAEGRCMRILAIGIDALTTEAGAKFAHRFLDKYDAMVVVDESSRIKNPAAKRTKAVMKLRSKATYARIGTGTPATNAPGDVFSQMEFLRAGLLETTSHRAFIARYAQLMSPAHPMMQHMIRRNPKMAYAQIVERDENGQRKWRNLDRLQRLLEPHTYRVRKEECLDLPPKVYQRRYFSMSPDQAAAYELMEEECRMQIGDKTIAVQMLNSGTKLQQITSGYVLDGLGAAHYVSEKNPRLDALAQTIEELDGQFIVFAKFHEEIAAITATLREMGIATVAYHGEIKREEREQAVDLFQSGKVRALVGSQQAAGIGLTLTAAKTVIYYSNTFNLEHRLQSEDRAHRKGTTTKVLIIDLVAEDSIDEAILDALMNKGDMAAAIVGDLRTKK